MITEGILFIRDLVDIEGNYLSLDVFQRKYPKIKINILEYYGIIEAIKMFQRKSNIHITSRYKIQESKCWFIINRGSKFIQQAVAGNVIVPAGIQKWKKKYEHLNWKLILRKHYKTAKDSKLIWFQTRLLHRILPTKRYLFFRKVVESPLCSFCGNCEETVSHLFWECACVNLFWKDLEKLLNEKCVHFVNFTFSDVLVFFGVKENIQTDAVFDLILLWAKLYVYLNQRQKLISNIVGFKQFLKNHYRVSRYTAANIDEIEKFEKGWLLYKELFD